MPRLDFWLEFASTYTYLSAMRIGTVAEEAGVTVRWRPFLLGVVFRKLEWPADSPFNWQPDKGRHMWRDMERMCEAYDLPLKRPEPFPQPSILAARVATAIAQDDQAAPDALPCFSRTVFHAEYGQGRTIGEAEVLSDCLQSAGLSSSYLEMAVSQPVKDALRTETETALAAGVFGAPTFLTTGGELFWGNDRLEQAIAWAKHESP
ncbi:MAG: 2-hydroxychromene-2-carboxylate isomerase [Pseudomonadota bacterium]